MSSYREFLGRTKAAAASDRRPLSGSLALTYRCNLACAHCYLGGCRTGRELDSEGWCAIIDQVADAGCLWLSLTGGEPLLRRDFAAIYRHATGRGLLVTVLTNATRVDEEVLALWRERPPHWVDISVYAFERATYSEVTGHDVRQQVFSAVEQLRQQGIRVMLKTPVTRQNADELPALRGWAAERGLRFRADADINATLGGSCGPQMLRLAPAAALAIERAQRRENAQAELHGGTAPLRFRCSARHSSFFVAPDGHAGLCVLDRALADLTRVSFAQAWDGPLRARQLEPLPVSHPCAGCELRDGCDACPPVLRMETGTEDLASPLRCDMARQRAAARGERRHRDGRTSPAGRTRG